MSGSPNGSAPAATVATDASVGPPVDAAAWAKEFERLVADVEAAAEEWGVERGSVEGRFVSALLGTTRWLGRLSIAAQARTEATVRENREAAERELVVAKEITRAAKAGLTQAEVMLTVVEVERDNLVAKMIKETLPLFAERLKEALIIREKRWNDDIKLRRFATVGAVTLAVVSAAYGLRAWQDAAATGAFYRCLAHPFQASGHYYCDVTSFFGTSGQ